MTTAYEIPLSPEAQRIRIALGTDTYVLQVVWNSVAELWMIDILTIEFVPVITGIPVVTGINLLEQYRYLGFDGSLIVQTDNDANATPTYENLGVTGRIYFVVEP